MTDPATETNTIGLPADAQGAKVFAAQLRQLIHDRTTSYHLPGPAKTLHRDADGNSIIPPGRYRQAELPLTKTK